MNVFEEMLKGFENIPREERSNIEKDTDNTKEQKAIKDMRRLLVLLEKRIMGKLDEKDTRGIHNHAEQWMESIAVLREYIQESELK